MGVQYNSFSARSKWRVLEDPLLCAGPGAAGQPPPYQGPPPGQPQYQQGPPQGQQPMYQQGPPQGQQQAPPMYVPAQQVQPEQGPPLQQGYAPY